MVNVVIFFTIISIFLLPVYTIHLCVGKSWCFTSLHVVPLCVIIVVNLVYNCQQPYRWSQSEYQHSRLSSNTTQSMHVKWYSANYRLCVSLTTGAEETTCSFFLRHGNIGSKQIIVDTYNTPAYIIFYSRVLKTYPIFKVIPKLVTTSGVTRNI